MSNIHSLGGEKKDPKKDKKEEKLEEFSQNGKTSGTSVLRPVNRNGNGNPNDLAEIVKNAKSQKAVSSEANDRNLGVITIYSNGFRIGDGEFRESKLENNKIFIEDLKKGNVPRELEGEIKKEWGDVPTVGVQLVNKITETFSPTKKTTPFEFSKSVGHSLSSSSSSSTSPCSLPAKELSLGNNESDLIDLPITLTDRKTIKIKVIPSTTIAQIYQHVKFVSKVEKFELLSGYPPKCLSDPTATVETSKLKKEKVTQRKL